MDTTKDVVVEVDRDRLVVRGERHDERSQDQNGHRLREVRYGSFHRAFTLPQHVTADAVTASYDAGVLSVRVAGAHTGTEARRIAITIWPYDEHARLVGEHVYVDLPRHTSRRATQRTSSPQNAPRNSSHRCSKSAPAKTYREGSAEFRSSQPVARNGRGVLIR